MRRIVLLLGIACTVFAFTGCTDRVETVSKFDGVTNVRETGGGYILYEIEGGVATCREHKSRSELACWSNNLPPM